MTMTPKTQEIAARIATAREELVYAVDGLEPAQLSHQPGENAWSIEDVLHHLALSEEATAKLLERMLRQAQENPLPPDPDPNRSVVGSIDTAAAAAAKRKAEAPDRVMPRSRVEAAESLSRLRVSRTSVLERLGALSPYDLSRLTFPHPFFGDFNTYQWVLLIGWHERRHAKQIERIKDGADFPVPRGPERKP
jgi:hypothetical protein